MIFRLATRLALTKKNDDDNKSLKGNNDTQVGHKVSTYKKIMIIIARYWITKVS